MLEIRFNQYICKKITNGLSGVSSVKVKILSIFEGKKYKTRKTCSVLLESIWSCKNTVNSVHKKKFNYSSHLNNADRFPWQVIGCVEQEGEDENKTTIPAKTDTLEPKSFKNDNQIIFIIQNIKTE